jgi:cell division septal protein FtsQ
MRNKLAPYAYSFITAAILLYAAIRLAIGGSAPTRLEIRSDAKTADRGLAEFIAENGESLRKLPAEIKENFPGIEHASVRDRQNGTLAVKIRHKKIIGIWTDGTAFYPLSESGAPIMTPFASKPAAGLVFRGAVPATAASMARIVSANPELAGKAGYLEYIENRRWNIRLANGALVMLPEDNPENAVARIKTSGILKKTFATLDLRDPRRMLVK